MSQSLFHQVSVSEEASGLGDEFAKITGLNPFFIRSQFQRKEVLVLNTQVSIPFSSGLSFRGYKKKWFPILSVEVSIPFSSGLSFRDGKCQSCLVCRFFVSIPFSSGLSFRDKILHSLTVQCNKNVSIPFSSGLSFRVFSSRPWEKPIGRTSQSLFHQVSVSEFSALSYASSGKFYCLNPFFIRSQFQRKILKYL